MSSEPTGPPEGSLQDLKRSQNNFFSLAERLQCSEVSETKKKGPFTQNRVYFFWLFFHFCFLPVKYWILSPLQASKYLSNETIRERKITFQGNFSQLVFIRRS